MKIKSTIPLLKSIILSSILNRDGVIDKSDVLIFGHDANRSINLGGKAYSPLLDSIASELETLGYRCQSISHFGSSLVGQKAWGDPVSINREFLYNLILKKIFFKGSSIENFYKTIIKSSGAKLVVTIGSPHALAQAAREAGVLHVELLHGFAHTFVPWGWDKLSKNVLPQAILSLDETSTSTFSSLKKHGIEIKTIPHPFLKRFTPQNFGALPNEWKANFDCKGQFQKNILISLQFGYAGERNNKKGILKNGLFYSHLEKVIESRQDVLWFFRLHPVQLRNYKYQPLIKVLDQFVSMHRNCDWKQASNLPFPSIAMNCSGNIGMSSTSCYDAAAMGVPSLMLCPTVQPGGYLEDRFLDLMEEGYVTKSLPSVDIINDWVDSVEPMSPRVSNLEDQGAWQGAVTWILKESGLSSGR